MTGRATEGTRRLDAPPWEPTAKLLDGHAGSSGSGMGAALVGQVPRYGMQQQQQRPPWVTGGARSGLTRRGIVYEYIRAHPGTHVRGMAKELRLATGDLQYHLSWLEKHGFVKTRKSGFYRFVYPAMVFQEEQEVLLGLLSQETPREILLCLLQEAALTQGDIARSLGHSQPTISWHMDRLIQLGVVSKSRAGGWVVYKLAADRDDVQGFVESYHPQVWKRWRGRSSNVIVSVGARRVRGGPVQRMGLAPPAVVELIGNR